MSTDLCPSCSRRIDHQPITLWDGRAYCVKCVEEAAPEMKQWASEEALRDVLEPADVHGWHLLAYMWPRFMLFVLLLAAIPMSLGMARQQWQGVLGGLVAIASFGAFAFVFLGLQALIGHFSFRWNLPREIAVRDGNFTIAAGGKVATYDLSGCIWHEGSAKVEKAEMFTRLQRGIVLQTPEGTIVIGHRPGSVERWRAFLRLAGVPQRKPLGCLGMIGFVTVGPVAGCVTGLLLGRMAVAAGLNPMWQGALMILGGFDGLVAPLLYATVTWAHAVAARQQLHPMLLAALFALVGAKVGIFAGWKGALCCALVNGGLGLALGWACRRKIKLEEEARATEREVREPGKA